MTCKFSKEHGCISTSEFLSFSHYLLAFHSERWGLSSFLSHPPLMPTLPFPTLLPLGECPVLLGLGHWSQFTPCTAPPVTGPLLDCNHSLTDTCFITWPRILKIWSMPFYSWVYDTFQTMFEEDIIKPVKWQSMGCCFKKGMEHQWQLKPPHKEFIRQEISISPYLLPYLNQHPTHPPKTSLPSWWNS